MDEGVRSRDEGRRVDGILGEWRARRDAGEIVSPEDVIAAHPELAETLRARFEALGASRTPSLRNVPPDRYGEFRVLGQGGMGIVYWALDTDLNREVAFKVVRPDAGQSGAPTPAAPIGLTPPARDTPSSQAFQTLKARFLQEAWVTAGLEHPGIVPVYEVGQTPEGVPYYTMRFVKGSRTLSAAIADVKGKSIDERLALLEPFLKVCDTIRYAHAHGVVHRDLKPDNVAVGEFGEVVVLDWGLAKMTGRPDAFAETWQQRLQEYRAASDLRTLAGALGTPGYMAPEAALGRTADVDARSDVYSLGAILFQCLTGRLPYEYRSYGELATKLLGEDAPEAATLDASVPQELSAIAARALTRDREARLATADALAASVREWLSRREQDREVAALREQAKAAFDAARDLAGDLRLHQLDRAASLVAQVLAKRAEDAPAAALLAEIDALRAQGVAERERAARGRTLRRAGVAALVLAAVAGAVVARALDERRRETEDALASARDERDAKQAALTRALAAEAAAEEERDAQVRMTERAVAAEQETRERLRDAYVAQARAARLSGRAGRRFQALEAVAAAAAIRPSPELRDEAIAALALEDVRMTSEYLLGADEVSLFPDRWCRRAAVYREGGDVIEIRSSPDGAVESRLPGVGRHRPWIGGFSVDGRLFWATTHPAGDDALSRVRVWDTASGAVVLDDAEGACAAISPDGARVAVARRGGVVVEHDVERRSILARWETGQHVDRMAYAPGGDRISASGTRAAAAAILDAGVVRRLGHGASVRGTAWSRDGRFLATACVDDHAWIWDVSGEPAVRSRIVHDGDVVAVSFSPDDDVLATVAWDGRIRLFTVARGREILTLPASPGPMSFAPDGRTLGLVAIRGRAGVLEFGTPAPTSRRVALGAWGTVPEALVSRSPDGRFYCGAAGETRIVDAATLQVVASVPVPGEAAWFGGRGDEIVTLDRGNLTVLRFDAPGGAGRIEVGPPRAVGAVGGRRVEAIAPVPGTNRWVAHARSADGARQLVVLDLGDGGARPPVVVRTIGEFRRDQCCLAVSADGRFVAAGMWWKPAVVVWDLATGAQVFEAPQDQSVLPSFSPDGRSLLTGTSLSYRLYDTATWQAGPTVRRPLAVWGQAAWSPDGRLVLATLETGFVELLDGRTLETVAKLESPEHAVPGVFSSDGREVLVGVGDGVVRAWRLDLLRAELAKLGLDVPALPAPKAHADPVAPPPSALVHLTARGAARAEGPVPDFAGVVGSPKIGPASGTRKVLAVLWDSRQEGVTAPPAAAVDALLFGPRPSVADWFAENSRGRMRIERAGCVGWIAAAKPAAHDSTERHGAGERGDRDGDGWIDGAGRAEPTEALRGADRDVDFAAFDTDRDGVLAPEELAIVLVEPSETPWSGPSTPLAREVPAEEPLVLDGVRIPRVTRCGVGSSPRIGGPARALACLLVGVPGREFGRWKDDQTPGGWTLLGDRSGTSHLGPFEKLKLGWADPVVVAADAVTDLPDVESTGSVLVVHDPAHPGEYVLVENRRRGTSYDAGAGSEPGTAADGLAVWHVVEDPELQDPESRRRPDEWHRWAVRLVRADGRRAVGPDGPDDAAALLSRRGAKLSGVSSPARLAWGSGKPMPFEIELVSAPGAVVRVSVRWLE